MNNLHLGPRGESLIKSFEQLRLIAYLPTPNDVPTIGYGSTRGVKLGMTITREQADRMFDIDVLQAVTSVNSLPCKLTQSMFDALVSLVFNVGPGAVKAGSTIGDALRYQLKARTVTEHQAVYFSAWAGFALWRKQAKKDLLGLARRRAKEMQLFFEDGLP